MSHAINTSTVLHMAALGFRGWGLSRHHFAVPSYYLRLALHLCILLLKACTASLHVLKGLRIEGVASLERLSLSGCRPRRRHAADRKQGRAPQPLGRPHGAGHSAAAFARVLAGSRLI